jgi:hypothetical protein
MTNLAGHYQFEKSNLVRQGFTGSLVIGRRQVFTYKKPPNFILYRSPKGKYTYLSSLFPKVSQGAENGPETYSLDLDGIYYILTLDREAKTGTITPTFTVNAFNNTVKGVNITPL